MVLPQFDASGCMPAGEVWDFDGSNFVYVGQHATMAELHGRFVAGFPQSSTRGVLYGEVQNLLNRALRYFDCVTLLVSGAFVSNSIDPDALYVALVVNGEEMAKLEGNQVWLLSRLFDEAQYQFGASAFTVQTGLARVFPEDHADHELGVEEQRLVRLTAAEPIPDVTNAGYAEVYECGKEVGGLDALLTTAGIGDSSTEEA